MSGAALALVLASAAVHAGWNGLVASARDTHAMTAIALVSGVVAMAPFVLILGFDVDGQAAKFIAGSAVLELTYFTLLATAYASADLTAVYPVARGSAPVFALFVSVVFLAAPVSGLQAAGVLVVAAGVMAVRGLRRPAGPLLWLALAIGACIAGYTLNDDHGLHHASPVPYFFCVLTLTAAGFWAGMAARGNLPAIRAELGWRPVVAGVGMATAYLLTLAALERAEAAPVAALRETSVVMATVAAALWGREHVSGARLAGAVAVVAGAAAIALG
jgi:drug/metabolite transporter (DMT)-like permease